VEKAIAYHSLLLDEEKKAVENIVDEYIFVKSDRRYFKVNLKDILFVEGLKDYVIIQLEDKRIITRMSLKNIQDLLPQSTFLRINRSYIVNREQIDSFDNNDVFIKSHEIAIGNSYRDSFFEELMGKIQGK
jgi:DNA-binding LytR/AlgR family response regulator